MSQNIRLLLKRIFTKTMELSAIFSQRPESLVLSSLVCATILCQIVSATPSNMQSFENSKCGEGQ